MKALTFSKFGPPDVLAYIDVPVPELKNNEVLVEMKAIGLTRKENKIETILKNNADYALTLNKDWQFQVMEITKNKGVDVVYDSVGSTLMDTSKTLTGGDI